MSRTLFLFLIVRSSHARMQHTCTQPFLAFVLYILVCFQDGLETGLREFASGTSTS